MIDRATLRAISAARLEEAEILFAHARYDGAVYICGYAIELALKARICDTLGWLGYPETSREFEYLRSFKVHHLDTFLRLSGQDNTIRQDPNHFANWSIVSKWEPEARYRAIGAVSQTETQAFLNSTKALLSLI